MASARRAERDGLGQAVEAVGHERDVGALEGDVGAGRAHGDADAGGGERGRVVDAVADHRDRAGLAFERGDVLELLGREQPGVDLVDAGRARDGPGDRLGVAGEHRDRDRCRPRRRRSARPAASGRGWSARPKRASRRSPSPSPIAVWPASCSAASPGGSVPSALLHQPRAAGPQRRGRRRWPSAPRPGSAWKRLGRWHRETAVAGGAAQRGGQRVLGVRARRPRRARARAASSSARTRWSCGSPSVSVPVLSSATARTRPRSSSAWPPLIRMPRRAAPPTAETTATGTEITSEHGQATISSASARYSHVSASPPNSERDGGEQQRGARTRAACRSRRSGR